MSNKNTNNSTLDTYKDLRDKIIQGILLPGENLREMDLSAQYNVSRNSVKKALLMLEKENLVSIEPNKGTKVRSFSVEEASEFLELRTELEGFIARITVPCITDAQIEELEGMLQMMKKMLEEGDLLSYSQNNRLFHQVIYDACPNRAAVDMTINLKNQMSKYNAKTILVPGRDKQSFDEHSALLSAIKARNCSLAETLARHHIENVRKTFIENFSLLF